jgi:SAM-dependent methyltransferase
MKQYLKNTLSYFNKITFNDLKMKKVIYLYAGDIPQNGLYSKFIGLSLSQANSKHIKHDVNKKLSLEDSCVDIYQSEDVFEHIDLENLPLIIDEIYRVLKPGGIFRLSLPDYGCDILYNRTLKNEKNELLFDPLGGGEFIDGKVVKGGHLWFPRYQTVKDLLEKTRFKNVEFYHYYDDLGKSVTNPIDYTIGHVMRTPDHDQRVKNPYRGMSIVVDCMK